MAKIRCPACGYDGNEPDDKFCGNCGANLKAVSEAAPATGQSLAETVQGQAPPRKAQTPASEPTRRSPATHPPKAKKAKLVIKHGNCEGHEFPLAQGTIANIGRWDPEIGSFPEIDLTEADTESHVSRKHGRIFFNEGKWYIEDLDSRNGTFLNKGPRINPMFPQELKDGDEIIVGTTFLQLVLE